MSKIFLTTQYDKFLGRYKEVDDAKFIQTLKDAQQFEALFPLELFGEYENRIRGKIYVCEQIGAKIEKVIGARIHYAIEFDLSQKEGKLSESSDLWMGSIYRTRKLPVWAISSNEWFSSESIDEIADNKKVEDPKLLGIEDYIKAEQE